MGMRVSIRISNPFQERVLVALQRRGGRGVRVFTPTAAWGAVVVWRKRHERVLVLLLKLLLRLPVRRLRWLAGNAGRRTCHVGILRGAKVFICLVRVFLPQTHQPGNRLTVRAPPPPEVHLGHATGIVFRALRAPVCVKEMMAPRHWRRVLHIRGCARPHAVKDVYIYNLTNDNLDYTTWYNDSSKSWWLEANDTVVDNSVYMDGIDGHYIQSTDINPTTNSMFTSDGVTMSFWFKTIDTEYAQVFVDSGHIGFLFNQPSIGSLKFSVASKAPTEETFATGWLNFRFGENLDSTV